MEHNTIQYQVEYSSSGHGGIWIFLPMQDCIYLDTRALDPDLSKFGPALWFFFTLEQSFLSFELQKTLHKVIFTKFLKLDPDPH